MSPITGEPVKGPPQTIPTGSNPFTKAIRKKTKLRIALDGPAGAGKTYSALKIANGMGGTIAAIDTENGSMSLYADICDFDSFSLKPPYSPERYNQLIKAAENSGYDILIIDSLSHAWAGSGGVLDMHSAEELRQKSGFRAWREITPKHNELVDTILSSNMHIIATMRSKQDYLIDQEQGNKVKKVGLAPIQREGMEYEFTIVWDLDHATHKASASKTRIVEFDKQVFVPSEETGRKLIEWMNSAPSEEDSNRDSSIRTIAR